MGRDLATVSPVAAELIDGLTPGLDGTAKVQPALTAVALATGAVLRERGVPCDVVAGHSVGELAAWSIAGGPDAAAMVQLARVRGEAMAAAAREAPGRMWAVDAGAVPDPLPEGLVLAVENPGQVVLSGAGSPPVGAVPVPTDGAWHSPGMAAAGPALAAAMERLPARALRIPVVSNHDGRALTDEAVLRAHLVAQLTHPVRWVAVLDRLRAMGVTDVVLLGPGKVLAYHLRRQWPEARVHRTDRLADLERVVAALAAPKGA